MTRRMTRLEIKALLTLTLPVLLISMDNTILGFAVPEMSAALSPSSTQLLWIIDIYSFVLAGLLVTMGAVGERVGRRRLLQIGAAGFTVASIAAAFAPTAEALIAARALLGVAGATLLPSTLSLIRNVFPDDLTRRTALAVWSAMFAVGAAFGPILGGLLLEHFWWGSVFLLGAPVTAMLLIAAPRFVPESKDPAPPPFDLVSAGLSMATMFPIVFAIKALAEEGVTSTAVVALAVGLGCGTAFVRRQRRLVQPMIDVQLFRRPRFRTAVIAGIAACFGFAGSLYMATQYFQIVLGLSPLRAGLQLLPAVAATIALTMATPQLAGRFGPFPVIAAGLTISTTGFAVLAQVDGSGLTVPTIGLSLINAGLAMAMTVAVDGIVASVPPERAGAAASVSETANELGIALGTAVLGTVVAVTYRADLVAVPGVSAETMSMASETLGAAEAAATELGGSAGAALQAATHAAFTSGMQTASWVAVGILTLAAIMAIRARRGAEDPVPSEALTF